MKKKVVRPQALLVVDVQNGFVARELPVPGATRIIPAVNRLARRFPLVVTTQDWHPADHLSFASQHPGKKSYDVIRLDGHLQVLWPDHCVMGTRGADFATGLDLRPFAAVFRKGMQREVDSYSAFTDNRGLHRTGLEGFLRDRGVRTVHVCGLALDYCVKATALDAARLGFAVVVHRNACRAVTPATGLQACKEMKAKGIRMTT